MGHTSASVEAYEAREDQRSVNSQLHLPRVRTVERLTSESTMSVIRVKCFYLGYRGLL